MFTGIVKKIASISCFEQTSTLLRYAVDFPSDLLTHLERGASVAIDGVCQTVVAIDKQLVWFEAIRETVLRTTFAQMKVGSMVNLERAARYGDEIGGHLLSGHICGTASIVDRRENIFHLSAPESWLKFLFPKGYVALDGISLTLVDVDRSCNRFSVHLIPETLKRTTFGQKHKGDLVNLELDSLIQAAVETVFNITSSSRR